MMHDIHHLAEFADYQRATNLSPATIRNRHSILTTFQRRAGIRLPEATIFDLRREVSREGISVATKVTIRTTLKAYYHFLVAEGIIDRDPTERLLPIRQPKAEPRPFTREQVDAMLNSGAYLRTRAMIMLGYFQGFRASQIARVHSSDLDLLSGMISTLAKGRKERRMPLSAAVRSIVPLMPADGWWFPARRGEDGHISGAAVTNLITLAKRRAGIKDPRLTPHSLRHGFGTSLVDEGVDIRIIQELMMHESLTSTQIYTGVSERLKRESVDRMNVIPFPSRSNRPRKAA